MSRLKFKFNDEILLEAVNYEDMFNALFNAFQNETQNEIKKTIQEEIKRAKQTLKKSDKVIWYLKLFKRHILEQLNKEFEKDNNRIKILGLGIFDIEDENLESTKEKFEKVYNKEVNSKLKDIKLEGNLQDLQRNLRRLEHFLSLPISAIENYNWKSNSMIDVLNDFKRFEEEWKKQSKELIPVRYEDEVIMKIGNYYWVDLETASCSKEGDAMGHCGNSPRSETNDTIYSLREKKKMGNDEYWHPYVTVDDDLMVWEVKGRGNHKPADKYIPYVVELFSNEKYIRGQRMGVGYLPENNLSFEIDFTEEQQEKIKEKNPYFKVVEPIHLVLDEYGLPAYIFEDDFEYERYTNRPIETEKDCNDLFVNESELNISNYSKLLDEGLEAYIYSDDRDVKLDTFTGYLKMFMEDEESKEEVVKAIEDFVDNEYEIYIDYIENRIDDTIDEYIDEEFKDFDWREDILDEEDRSKLAKIIDKDWEWYLRDYRDHAETVIQYMEDIILIDIEDYKKFWDTTEKEDKEFIEKMIMKVIRDTKKKALGDDFEDGDELSQAELDRRLGQLEFDFGESKKNNWRNLI